jgi:Phage-related protein
MCGSIELRLPLHRTLAVFRYGLCGNGPVLQPQKTTAQLHNVFCISWHDPIPSKAATISLRRFAFGVISARPSLDAVAGFGKNSSHAEGTSGGTLSIASRPYQGPSRRGTSGGLGKYGNSDTHSSLANRTLLFFHPKGDTKALPPLLPAFQSADMDYAAELCNSNFFEHGLRLSGLITLKNEVSEEKMARIKAALDQLAGAGNEHVVMALDNDAHFESFSGTTKDMDFERLGAAVRDKIGGSFGVPRFLLGVPESANRASARESRRIFWENILLPQMRDIEDKLNEQLLPFFGDPELALRFDLSGVEAMAEDRREYSLAFDAFATALAKLAAARILTAAEARKLAKEKFSLEIEDEIAAPAVPATPGKGLAAGLLKLKNMALQRLSAGQAPLPTGRTENLLTEILGNRQAASETAARLREKVKAFRTTTELSNFFDHLAQLVN